MEMDTGTDMTLSSSSESQVTPAGPSGTLPQLEGGDTSDPLTCRVCKKLMCVPTMVPCGHSFCFACIERAVTFLGECPVCHFDVKPLVPDIPFPPLPLFYNHDLNPIIAHRRKELKAGAAPMDSKNKGWRWLLYREIAAFDLPDIEFLEDILMKRSQELGTRSRLEMLHGFRRFLIHLQNEKQLARDRMKEEFDMLTKDLEIVCRKISDIQGNIEPLPDCTRATSDDPSTSTIPELLNEVLASERAQQSEEERPKKQKSGHLHMGDLISTYFSNTDTFQPSSPTPRTAEVVVEPSVEPRTETLVQVRPKPPVQVRPKTPFDPRTEPLVEVRPKPAFEPRAKLPVERRTKPLVEVRPKPLVEPRTETLAEVRPKPPVEPRTETLAEVRPKPTVEPRTKTLAEVLPKPHVEPPTETLVEVRPKDLVEPRTETLVEPRTKPPAQRRTRSLVEVRPKHLVEVPPKPSVEFRRETLVVEGRSKNRVEVRSLVEPRTKPPAEPRTGTPVDPGNPGTKPAVEPRQSANPSEKTPQNTHPPAEQTDASAAQSNHLSRRADPLAGFNERFDKIAPSLFALTKYSHLTSDVVLEFGAAKSSGSRRSIKNIVFDKDDEFFAVSTTATGIAITDFEKAVQDDSLDSVGSYNIPSRSQLSSLTYNPFYKEVLACCDEVGCITIHDASTLGIKQDFIGHTNRCWSLDYHPINPKLLASSSSDGMVKIWSPEQSAPVTSFVLGSTGSSVKFHPSQYNSLAVAASDRSISMFDIRKSGKPFRRYQGHKGGIGCLRFLDDQTMVSAGTDSTLKIWSVSETEHVRSLRGHTNRKSFIGLSSNGPHWIACGSEDHSVYVYTRELRRHLFSFSFPKLHASGIPNVKPSDGKRSVSAVCWKPGTDYILCENSESSVTILKLMPAG